MVQVKLSCAVKCVLNCPYLNNDKPAVDNIEQLRAPYGIL